MDINSMSRELYQDVPETGEVIFTVDKIGLRIETIYLNQQMLEPWKRGNVITILTFGETSQVNVHAEFEPWEKNLGKKCFDAICLLVFNGVFKNNFTIPFINFCKYMAPFILFDKTWYSLLLGLFFKVVEWEWAWDFFDNPLLSYIDTSNENKKAFRRYINSNYSKDGKVKRRTKERNGKPIELSKGRQQSLVNIYDRGKKIESDRLVERVEIRQQGKYKKDLTMDLLAGTKEEALSKSLVAIKKSVNKVIHKDALRHTDFWEQNVPSEYKQIFINKS